MDVDVVTQEMIRRVKASVLACSSCGATFLGEVYKIPPGKKVGFSRKGRGVEPKFPCWNCDGFLVICDAPKKSTVDGEPHAAESAD